MTVYICSLLLPNYLRFCFGLPNIVSKPNSTQALFQVWGFPFVNCMYRSQSDLHVRGSFKVSHIACLLGFTMALYASHPPTKSRPVWSQLSKSKRILLCFLAKIIWKVYMWIYASTFICCESFGYFGLTSTQNVSVANFRLSTKAKSKDLFRQALKLLGWTC